MRLEIIAIAIMIVATATPTAFAAHKGIPDDPSRATATCIVVTGDMCNLAQLANGTTIEIVMDPSAVTVTKVLAVTRKMKKQKMKKQLTKKQVLNVGRMETL